MLNKKRVGLFFLILAGSLITIEAMGTKSLTEDLTNRALHILFPNREKDEAYIALKDENKMSAEEKIKTQNSLMAGADEDYFADMDYGITRPENQDSLRETLNVFIPNITKTEAVRRTARGRNNWIVWTGGNDRFWNYMTRATLGNFDLLKTISNYSTLPAVRNNRWEKLGLVNEPCFEAAKGPRKDRFGLWLDQRSNEPGCKPDPFEVAAKYPGIKIKARGTSVTWKLAGEQITQTLDVGSSYGYATGVVGLRLFTNPDFDAEAAKKWDPVKYYNDPNYYNDPSLIRPYRVGMSCAFCHVGPNPTRPPENFNSPKWANLNSNAGAQYFWVDRIFAWDWSAKNRNSFMYQLIHTSRPGTLDTSLISSDMINNPRSMNAVYNLKARMIATQNFNHLERLVGDEALNDQFNKLNKSVVPEKSMLNIFYLPNQSSVFSPRVLKDGADSVGALGALNRVYINIGLFSEEWIQNFIPLIGGTDIKPFQIRKAQDKSIYWQANVNQTPDVGLFFLAASRPDKLANTKLAAQYLKAENDPIVMKGKEVFANSCARCHSSKLPEKAYSYFKNSNGPLSCSGANYKNCWDNYWNYSLTEEFKTSMRDIVMKPDFLEDNFLSTELRVPSSLLDTQLCSPIATNAIRGNIWDNFSSDTYKRLPSAGKFTVNHIGSDLKMHSEVIDIPAGGRGYIRPASLISLWATAPFLSNNTVGEFDYRGTVEGRMKSFENSIQKLLNPETRSAPQVGQITSEYTTSLGYKLNGTVDVTSEDTYLKIPKGYMPKAIYFIIKKIVEDLPKSAQNLDWIEKNNYAFSPIGESETRRIASTPAEEPTKKNWFSRFVASVSGRNPNAYPGDEKADFSPEEAAELINVGPIPAGVPVNLVANLNIKADDPGMSYNKLYHGLKALIVAVADVRSAIRNNPSISKEEKLKIFMAKAADPLLAISKCSDFVVDRGHYFGTKYSTTDGKHALSQDEQYALTEYLKHF